MWVSESLKSFFWVDLRNVDQMSFDFDLGKPFKPYEQLMGVLPFASMEQIPLAYRVRFFIFFLRSVGCSYPCFFLVCDRI